MIGRTSNTLDEPRSLAHDEPNGYAATVALATSGHSPFSPRVLTHRSMETAVLPPSWTLNSVRTVGRLVRVRNDSAAGAVGAGVPASNP